MRQSEAKVGAEFLYESKYGGQTRGIIKTLCYDNYGRVYSIISQNDVGYPIHILTSLIREERDKKIQNILGI